MQNYTLTDLIKPNILQQIQEAFSEFTGMASVATDADGVPVTSGTNCTHFCADLIQNSEAACGKCRNCTRNGAAQALKNGAPAVYRCHAGLVDFAAPVTLNGELIGCLVGGQVMDESPDGGEIRRTASEYGIDSDEYLSALHSVKELDSGEIERSAGLLFNISKALSAMALHCCSALENAKSTELAARSQSDYIMSLTSDMTSVTLDYTDTAKAALESGDPAKMKEALEVIASRGAGASEMIRDSVAYLQMTGRRFRTSEEEYDPRKVFPAIIETISQKKDSAKTTLSIQPEVPDRLLGDAGCICQLIENIVALYSENGAGAVDVGISSFRHGYAECLKISLTCRDSALTEESTAKISQIITSDEEYYAETMSELNLSIIRNQLRTMSGRFDIRCDGGIVIDIIVPQLKLDGGVTR